MGLTLDVLTEVLMFTASLATNLGLAMIVIAIVAVLLSPYRRWIGFMFAGMMFWGVLELVRFGVQSVFDLPTTYSYLTALSLAMVLLTLLLLREDRVAQKQLANRRYIEHTPIYDDEQ